MRENVSIKITCCGVTISVKNELVCVHVCVWLCEMKAYHISEGVTSKWFEFPERYERETWN
jgi:hypothetical protein